MYNVNDALCQTMEAMKQWLAQPAVLQALHITNDRSGISYDSTEGDVRPLYTSLMSQYRILLYSGDVDACVPYIGTETWTRGLGFPVINDWHSWTAKPDLTHAAHKAGYAITYSTFQFITVNGAGHLVPLTQPGYALGMFQKFLNGDTF